MQGVEVMTMVCFNEPSAFCGISYSIALIGLQQEGSKEAWTYRLTINSRDETDLARSLEEVGLFEDMSMAECEAHTRARSIIEACAAAVES